MLFYLNAIKIERSFRPYKVSAEVILSSCAVNLSGSDEAYVTRAAEELKKNIADLHTQELSVSDEWILCFESLNKADVINAFRLAKLRAGLDVRDSRLYVCSNTAGEAQKGLAIVNRLIRLRAYPSSGKLNSTCHQLIVASPDLWKQHIEFMKELFPGVVVVYDDINSVIQIASPESHNMSAVVNQLDRYFHHLRMNCSSVLFENEDQLMLVELNSGQIVARYPAVNLMFDEESKLCTVKSTEDAEPAAALVLQMKTEMVSDTVLEESEAFYDWMRKSDKGRRKLADICKLSKTIITFPSQTQVECFVEKDVPRGILPNVNVIKGDICDLQVRIISLWI